MGFPGSSAGKESACNAGDPASIPGLGRSPGEGIGYPHPYSWASLVAQVVKNPPAMQGSPWGLKESDTTEQLSTAYSTKKMFFPKLHIYLLYLYELIDSKIINGYNFYNHHFAQLCLMLVPCCRANPLTQSCGQDKYSFYCKHQARRMDSSCSKRPELLDDF